MKEKILIVDDSELVHQIFTAQLDEADYKVVHAYDGIEAINVVFAEMPDLILLDVNMPKINGYQVCRLLKDYPATKEIPIIIQTSKSTAVSVADPKVWSFETGADGYIDKEEELQIVQYIKPFLEKREKSKTLSKQLKSITEIEIMTALSHLLDKQLYVNVTYLKELNERKNAFVANVSHEFKSPLAAIKGYLDNMGVGIYGNVSAEQEEVLKMCIQTVNRLNRLVSDLLDLSKIEAGKMTLNKQEVDVRILLEEILKTYAVIIDQKKINIKKELDPRLPLIMGDKDRLMQMVINILYNSIKYSPEHGVLIIRLKLETAQLRLEIQDAGPGIAKENLDKIFDKFVRISAEKREGTGLGLPIAKDIIALHGGRIWAESEEGKGSKFIVLLPIETNS